MSTISIPASYYRGGTSKGVFFKLSDLPQAAQQAGAARDALLLRILGSPDPYGKQIDGLGNASSSTSKAVILDKSQQPNHDVDYLFGQVAIDKPFVDWSGNCGNLTAAVGAFAIQSGLIDPTRIPENGICPVRIWQANINKTIIAHIPIANGAVQETGDFMLDGVAFPSAEIRLEFLDPADNTAGSLFPTGNTIDTFHIPNVGNIEATLIQAGIPTVFIHAEAVGCKGTELQTDINNNSAILRLFETIRIHAAVKMGLISHPEDPNLRQHTPKIALIAPPQDYTASSGSPVYAHDVDLLVRAISMGQLHHAMMGTAAVAIAAAAAIPNTLVSQVSHSQEANLIRFGHPSGTLRVGASARETKTGWEIDKVEMSRSARLIMRGEVYIPADTLIPHT